MDTLWCCFSASRQIWIAAQQSRLIAELTCICSAFYHGQNHSLERLVEQSKRPAAIISRHVISVGFFLPVPMLDGFLNKNKASKRFLWVSNDICCPGLLCSGLDIAWKWPFLELRLMKGYENPSRHGGAYLFRTYPVT